MKTKKTKKTKLAAEAYYAAQTWEPPSEKYYSAEEATEGEKTEGEKTETKEETKK